MALLLFHSKSSKKKCLRGTNTLSLHTYNYLIIYKLSMREKELLKIALQGNFVVIKISKTKEGIYMLKQMCATLSPGWRIVEKSSKLSDIEFRLSIMRHSYKHILNASERFRLSDLTNLAEAGFQVIRISPSNKLIIKRFNPSTKSWVKLSSFTSANDRENFLNEVLYHNSTIIVD